MSVSRLNPEIVYLIVHVSKSFYDVIVLQGLAVVSNWCICLL